VSPAVQWRPPTLADEPRVVVITPRQADVLAGICHGHSSAQIGTRLLVSEETVRTHTKRLYASLGARSRSHAAALVCSGQVTVVVRDDYWNPRTAA
jgi:DNA-binding CsgD family transcriptional regulator